MANIFNAAEIIDMGITKEKKRRDFYGLAAKSFKQKDMKELFSKLRDWEEQHIKKFSAIRDTLEESEVTETYKGEFELYMKAASDDLLYNQVSPGEFANNVKTPLDALAYGMSFEKDAIIFFNELLGYMEPAHRDKIIELLNEEKKHLIFLFELKKKYR